MGNDDAALAGFEHYLTLDPKDPFVQYQMGEIWLDRGDLARAEQLFRHALELDPQVAAAKNALGVIALQRGDPADGRTSHPRSARRQADAAARALQSRAAGRTARRRPHAPNAEYFEELKQHPENFKAAFNLSRLYEQVGDREGQIGALKQSIVSNPRFAEGHFFLAKVYLDVGTNLDEAIAARAEGTRARAAVGVRAARPLRARRHLQPAGARARGAREVARGRALEARSEKKSHGSRGNPGCEKPPGSLLEGSRRRDPCG